MEEKNRQHRGKWFAIGLALGIPLGTSIGLAMGNLALGPAIGLAIGAGLGAALERSYRNREVTETPQSVRRDRIMKVMMILLLAGGILALSVIYFLIRKKL